MALATRVGIDSAGGGTITGGLQSFVTIDGAPWAVVGDAVAPHGSGIHAAATMAEGVPWLTIGGAPVCRAGHLATCGDTATGSGPVEVIG